MLFVSAVDNIYMMIIMQILIIEIIISKMIKKKSGPVISSTYTMWGNSGDESVSMLCQFLNV